MLSDMFGRPIEGSKCRHPRDKRAPKAGGGWECVNCGKVTTAEAVKRGKRSREYGTRAELDAARKYGGRKTGHANGPDDISGKDWLTQMKTHRRPVTKEWLEAFAKLEASRGPRQVRLLVRFVGRPGVPPQDFFIVPGDTWLAMFGRDE